VNQSHSKPVAFAMVVLCVMVILTTYPLAAQDKPEGTPTAEAGSIEMLFGSGSFNLTAPENGLADLTSYRATLMLSFDGTIKGQPSQWSRTYTMLVETPAVRSMMIDTTGDNPLHVFMAEIEDTSYEQSGEALCSATALTQVESLLAETWEPASFINSVIGADDDGTESVNSIETHRYTFSESALGISGIAEATGELWVTTDNTLVRLTLVTTGGANYFGAGIQGTLNWNYQLTDVNQPVAVTLPVGCPSGIISIPILPDATDLIQLPGMTSYLTLTDLPGTTAFYQAQLPATDEQSLTPVTDTDSTTLIDFTQGEQRITIVMSKAENGTLVHIMRASIAADAPTDATTEVLTVSTASGTVDIPLLPDATSVIRMPNAIGFNTGSDIASAALFYDEKLIALGFQLYRPLFELGGSSYVYYALDNTVIVLVLTESAEGNNVFILVQ